MPTFTAAGEPYDFELSHDSRGWWLHVPKTGLIKTSVTKAQRNDAIAIVYSKEPRVMAAIQFLAGGGCVRVDRLLNLAQVSRLSKLITEAGGTPA
jgi:hypothetical protein